MSGQQQLIYQEGRWLWRKQGDPDRIQREIQALQALSRLAWTPGQPWGLPVLSQAGNDHFLRAYIPGQSLSALLSQQRWTPRFLALWLERLEQLLEAIHQQGWWHGDVSPQNVLLTECQAVVLVDWGAPGWGTPPYARPGLEGPEADLFALQRLRQELLPEPCPVPDRASPRLFGREETVHWLSQNWHRASSRDGTWVGLAGASGSGKSCLMRELLWLAPRAAWGQGTTLTTPVAYNLFQSLLEKLDLPESLPVTEDPRDSIWRQMATTFPKLAAVIGAESEPVSSPLAPMLLAEGWVRLLQALAEEGPLLLIFDDVQWMDESSAALLSVLSRRSVAGLMVVLAWRSEEFTPPTDIQLNEQRWLAPLRPDQVLLWCRREGIEESKACEVADWAQGSPLLVADWLNSGQEVQLSSRAGLVLQERLAQLNEGTRKILQVAALLGKQFSLATLQVLPLNNLQEALQEALRSQLILPNWSFSHDRVREALLADFPLEQQQYWHGLLGQAFEQLDQAPPCAFHYSHSQTPQRALPFALQAARTERRRAAYSSATYFYELVCHHQKQPALHHEYAQMLESYGRDGRCLEILNEALSLQSDGQLRTSLMTSLGKAHYNLGSYSESYNLLGQALSRREGVEHGKIWMALIESTFQANAFGSFMRLFFRHPWSFWKGMSSSNLARADFVLLSETLGLAGLTRGWRLQLLQKRRQMESMEACSVLNRLQVSYLARDAYTIHRSFLDHILTRQELKATTHELGMTYMQLVLHHSCSGQFSRVLRLGKNLENLAALSGNHTWVAVANLARAVATGGHCHLMNTELKPLGMWRLHGSLAQALCCWASGRPDQALTLLESIQPNPMAVDRGLHSAWTSTAHRRLAQATPRRWAHARSKLLTIVQHRVRQTLNNPFARLWYAQAQREMALSLVGLGRAEEAQSWFARAVLQAHHGNAYQEALAWQDWGRVGLELGWPRAQEKLERGQEMLAELGAWWELPNPAPGLQPLQEATEEFLQSRDLRSRNTLAQRLGANWMQMLENALEREASSQAEWEKARLRSGQQHRRLQAFLQNGPLQAEVYSTDTPCADGIRVELSEQEYALLTPPLRRAELSVCLALIKAERKAMRRRLKRLQRMAASTPQLAQELAELRHWHLPRSPKRENLKRVLGSATVTGQPAWKELTTLGRQTLLAILREALQNRRKHAPGPSSVCFQRTETELVTCITGQAPNAQSPPNSDGFGLTSMHFRASLAGGRLEVDPHFEVRLWLPLKDNLNTATS
ncbi:AAA family ATPase [bacterium]|nr:AAA family ATPase [bacterium]